MIKDGFQDKLLKKLSAIDRERLDAETMRKINTPRARSTFWADFRGSAAWSMRQQRRFLATILACVLIAVLAAKVSPALAVVWVLALCLVVLYSVCRFLYAILSMGYVFLTWKTKT
ncbi:hypothetical protein [Pararhizobium antarcticum]|uniref:Uncharacterized protein n=1 Tax=Pararhizobium antarcticum TaxID=1798805 RepID=A0A657LP67_9HYPH|nr:hypothetical protein [Pararhizobium antarcticum]OJF92435.1 hypothetical protein AX760_22730 [Pararhizobium antarcticum]OJF99126.1 hypothetical protein AX761_11710 [Rhizobium sp. 58]